MYLNKKASKQQEDENVEKKKTSCNWEPLADGHRPKQQLTKDNQITFLIKSPNVSLAPSPFPKGHHTLRCEG